MENEWAEQGQSAPEQLEMPWGHAVNPDSISVSDLEKLCKDIATQRDKYEQVNNTAKQEYQLLQKMESKLLFILEQLGKDNYSSAVGKFRVMHRTSVKIPRGENWDAFVAYLKQTGQDKALLTVNSQSLNGWLRNRFNTAKDEGRELESIPGLEAPSISKVVSFSRG